ncbi:MAG: hypothetical protein JF588_23795 [Caulobacterales bacterium]|nr:hypothetical protein [Caulobacterales bacterium]
MVQSIDSNLLLNIYNSKLNLSSGTGTALLTSSSSAAKKAPTAPWSHLPTPKQTSATVASALAGHKLIDENAAKLDLPGASPDYKKLFALYNGLEALGDLASAVQQKNLTPIDKQRLQETFDSGLKEVQGYVDQASFEKLRLTSGTVAITAKSTLPVPATPTEYVTRPLYAGSSADDVPAFQGNVDFTITIKRSGVTHDVDVNLADMGLQTRSMANVVNFINGKLSTEGVDTRIRTVRLPGVEKTTTAGGQTIKLGMGPDQWSLKVVPAGEAVSFSTTATAPAVYMSQAVGDPNPDHNAATNDGVIQQQLLKFQTDTSTVDAPIQGPNEANWVDGREFAKTLGPEVKTVHATKVAADGSVYVLADVTGKTAGQDISGTQDVALLKYDSAGNLQFTQTLGASDSASGLGLAISDDGKKVAVVGSVVGQLNGAVDGALNSGPTGAFADQTDSFVTVFNSNGDEQWTERRAARAADEASQVAFGTDGTVYVAGRSKSAMPGATTTGDWDNYVEAFSPPDSKGKIAVPFTQNFGTAGADKPAGLVVDGTNLVTASVENGHGILRRYDISSGTPVLSATRDLGDLQAGDITGLAIDNGKVIVAGSTTNAALSGGTITSAYSGGVDAFAASFNADLSADPADAIAYYGGAGDDHATALSVSNGKVFIAGSAGTDLPGQPAVGKKDGFLAQLDIGAGTVDWSRRFTGKDGFAAPTSIAVDTAGASALDRLGLPQGTINATPSAFLTTNSSLRAGDQFTVKVGTSGVAQTVTIDNADTLDTLAQKIRRATAFQSDVTIGLSSAGVRSMTIKPNNSRTILEFSAGKADKDALSLLGIPEGIVDVTTVNKAGKVAPADGKGQIYGLGLPSDLNLNSTDGATHAANLIAQAQSTIRNAYKDMVAALNPQAAQQAAAKASTGKVPAYLTAQIANYQAALDRLTGGQ